MTENTMRAVVYDGPFKVSVQQVQKPTIIHPDDIIVKGLLVLSRLQKKSDFTTTCICGSDLHMYEGRTTAEPGMIFGHENLGVVKEVGSAVTSLKEGDRVVMPFNVACGRCRNCVDGKSAFCTHVNPGFAGGIYGYASMGPYAGGQAEYLRVPFADYTALKLPSGTENASDFVLLADIFPTGWHGVQLSGFRAGESIAVFGGGPVGLMAAYSAQLLGASAVYVVDKVPARLAKAEEIGCTPIDLSKGDAAEQILSLRGGREVDRGVDAVGFQAHISTPDGDTEKPSIVLEGLVKVVRATGGLGIPGVYVPADPRAPDSASARGYVPFPIGKFFEKGLTMRAGQCNVKAYDRYLRDLIIAGKAKPSFVVSHHLPLDDAEEAYDKFDKRVQGYTKVLLHP